MKQKNEKDKRLKSLFSEYVQNEEMPSTKVTQTAKEYLNKQRVTQNVTVTATATAETNNVSGGQNIFKSNKNILYIAAFVIFAIAVTLILYFTTKKSSKIDFLVGASPVTQDQLSETTAEYSDKGFLPFVNTDEVTDYKEFALKREVNSNNANGETVTYYNGDAVVYYISFDTTENVEVSVYVEANGIYLTDLNKYKHAKTEKDFDGIKFFIESEQNRSICYFHHNNFGYNLMINTSDQRITNEVLTYISDSFKK